MKMTYRGVPYQYNPTSVKVENKNNEVKFRGCTYQLSHAVMNVSESAKSGVVYRGVSVATGKEIRFLGRTCEYRQIMLAPMGA
jgi:hypothetical protein